MTQANSSSTPVFRTIEVGKGVPITLGEPLSAEAKALAKEVKPQVYRLDPGTFGDAEEIDIHVTVDGVVRLMDFKYAAGTSYQDMVANFVAQMGPPTSHHGGGDEVTVWEDAETVFRLVGSASGIRSKLRDVVATSAQATS